MRLGRATGDRTGAKLQRAGQEQNLRDSVWPTIQGIAWIRIEEAEGLSPASRGDSSGGRLKPSHQLRMIRN
jgi:hypothetical protein